MNINQYAFDLSCLLSITNDKRVVITDEWIEELQD